MSLRDKTKRYGFPSYYISCLDQYQNITRYWFVLIIPGEPQLNLKPHLALELGAGLAHQLGVVDQAVLGSVMLGLESLKGMRDEIQQTVVPMAVDKQGVTSEMEGNQSNYDKPHHRSR